MKISVLICTYKRRELLDKCLKSIIENSIELPDEVIIVDGEEGKIKDIILKWKDKFPNIKLIPTKNINLAVSRNIGLAYCNGDIIALTDDDVLVSVDWIRKIKQLHKEHIEAGAIGGKIKSIGNRLIDRIADLVVFPFPDKKCYIRTIAGANASYKNEVVSKIGKFDETLFRGEDVDYNWRILKKGYKIYYDPELKVFHQHRATLKGLLNQIFMYGRAYYLVRKKWPDMYCVYPHSIRNIKDILKICYFFLGIIIEPIYSLKNTKGFITKIIMFPILVISQIVWRFGMIFEKTKCFLKLFLRNIHPK